MGELLPEEDADEIVRSARATIGDSLRSVTYFTDDDYEQLYIRSDLAEDADLESFVRPEWADYETTSSAYRESELGDYAYTIRVFETGFLLRVTAERGGVFVTTDGVTLRDFDEAAAALAELQAEME